MTTVDPDDLTTWPEALRVAASRYRPGGDLLADDRLFDLLDRRPLRAYHATRLLPHEVESIRRDGLRPLSVEHVEQRLTDAERVGALTADELARLAARHVFSPESAAHGQIGGRRGRVCAVVGRSSVSRRGLGLPLSTWGGEAIYWTAGDLADRLAQIGAPAVVVLNLELSGPIYTAGPVLGLFSALLRGEPLHDAEVHVLAPIAPSAVVAVWQPGSAGYDAFPDLPR